MSTIVGIATGCDAGQRPREAYLRCCLWSGLSSRRPSQQFGNVACSWSIESSEQRGMVANRGVPPTSPQLQATIPFGWRPRAWAFPASMTTPFGGAVMCSLERLT